MAGAMGLSEEQFRQSKLEYLLGEERRKSRGHDLGEQAKKILDDLGPGYRLVSVTWNSSTLSWRLEVETQQGQQNVVLSWGLVDDALDARTPGELQRLRNMIWFGLGRRDLIFEKRG